MMMGGWVDNDMLWTLLMLVKVFYVIQTLGQAGGLPSQVGSPPHLVRQCVAIKSETWLKLDVKLSGSPTNQPVGEADFGLPKPMLNSSSTDSEISQHESCTTLRFLRR